jgi:hypothetical protein
MFKMKFKMKFKMILHVRSALGCKECSMSVLVWAGSIEGGRPGKGGGSTVLKYHAVIQEVVLVPGKMAAMRTTSTHEQHVISTDPCHQS